MQLEAVLRQRRMTRSFSPGAIDAKRLDHIVDLARRVPSAGFAQGVDLLVLTSEAARQRFWSAASEAAWRESSAQAAGLLAAPVIVLPLADPARYVARYGESDKAGSDLAGSPASQWPVPYWLVDAAFCALALLLVAEDEGLGALFFRLHGDPEAVLEACGAPPDRLAIGAVAIGERAPGEEASGTARRRDWRPLAEVAHFDRW